MTEYYFEAQVQAEDGEWYRIDNKHELFSDAAVVVWKWSGLEEARNHLRVQQVIPTLAGTTNITAEEA